MKPKVLVGMSGGVDSSVCAALLQNDGFEVVGVTLNLFGDTEKAQGDAKAVCDTLGIQHAVFNLQNEFKQFVIDDFINEYIAGRTPNPCLVCNRKIKFGEMLKIADKLGCQKIATGHYAKIIEKDGRFLLCRAEDRAKDQSYVLYCLNQEQLSRTVLPLSCHSKDAVRKTAEEYSLVNADKKDSQDICFVPDGDYAAFIERTANFVSEGGNYLDINGKVLGQHKGVIRYTIGQRKGLGIALGKPAFVIDKNPVTNEVIIGDEEHLFYKRVYVENLNFIPFDELKGEMKVDCKLRYRHSEQPAVIKPYKNGVLVEFNDPQRAPSPGQAAVFYDGDIVVGGGTIVCGIE
ncbi:MAG: tRNA 2-thiouridine(34) synthase MnmA [Clostridia bacterium]|nr:tRNA 2-thiouridine(34) synthase MnmA [Clostridia bacterium]